MNDFLNAIVFIFTLLILAVTQDKKDRVGADTVFVISLLGLVAFIIDVWLYEVNTWIQFSAALLMVAFILTGLNLLIHGPSRRGLNKELLYMLEIVIAANQIDDALNPNELAVLTAYAFKNIDAELIGRYLDYDVDSDDYWINQEGFDYLQKHSEIKHILPPHLE